MPDDRTTTRVYVDMVGDPFHAGHVALLQQARSHGDDLSPDAADD
jgi:glycerol-3-phosphate cytidylyltransferase-like family protein